MPGELDGLKFVVEVDTQGSEGKLNTLANALKKIAQITGLDKVADQLKDFVSDISQIDDSITEKYEKLGAALSKVKVSKAAADNIQNFVGGLYALDDDTIAKWERMSEVINSEGFSDLSKSMAGFAGLQFTRDSVDNIQDFVGALYALDTNTINNWQQMASILQSIPQVNIPQVPGSAGGGATSTAAQQANAGAQNGGVATANMQQATQASQALAKQTALVSASVGQAQSKFYVLGQTAAQVMTLLPRMIGERFFTQVKQATAGMGQFLGSLKRVALYRLIRSAIAALTQGFQEGIKNLYAYSNAMGTVFAQSMDRLASSSLYLKNSLAAMAAPIINAIVPAVEIAIDAIVKLFNYFNMLISAFTGKGITTVAKKVGTSFDGAAGSAGGANKAAKELKKTILGFDELNVLNDQNNGSGGGGGGAGGGGAFSDMFEEVDVPTEISDFGKRLADAFKKQKFEEVGKILAEKLNEVVDNIKWADIGDKVGLGLRAVIDIAYGFMENLDFRKLGNGIATFFNHAISNVNWSNLGRLLTRKWTGLFDFIYGVFEKLDVKKITKSISDFVTGINRELTSWIKKTDWSEVAKTLLQKVKEAIQGIDFADIVKTFGELLQAGFNARVQLFQGIGEWIFEQFKNGFPNIPLWIWNNILDPFFAGLLGEKTWNKAKSWASQLFGVSAQAFQTEANKASNAVSMHVAVANESSSWVNSMKTMWQNASGGKTLGKFKVDLQDDSSNWWKETQRWWNSKAGKLTTKLTLQIPDVSVKWTQSKNNGNSVYYPKITATYAARGAIIDAATMFGSATNPLIAGEAGREAILPLDRNTSWMDDIAERLHDRTSDGQDNYTSTYMALVDFYQAYMQDDMSSIRVDARRQADKDETINVSAESVTASLARKNLRDGRTTVPVG